MSECITKYSVNTNNGPTVDTMMMIILLLRICLLTITLDALLLITFVEFIVAFVAIRPLYC